MSGPRVGEGAPGTGSVARLVVAWTIVGVPALWGVAQTVIKSLALFR